MDDGFECSCPAEYKGPTCQGKLFITTEVSTLELVSLTCLPAVLFSWPFNVLKSHIRAGVIRQFILIAEKKPTKYQG